MGVIRGTIFIKPYLHAKSSAKKFGGVPEDYLKIHENLVTTKKGILCHIHTITLCVRWQ